MSSGRPPHRRLLIVHASPDLYGADRQLLQTIDGLVQAGWQIVVSIPTLGPLVPLLESSGARVVFDDLPVLRRSLMSPHGLMQLAIRGPGAMWRLQKRIREVRPDAVYVNNVIIPMWMAAAKLVRVPVLVQVHQAGEEFPRGVRLALAAPLLLADEIVVNSAAAGRALTNVIERLSRRMTVVHNGVSGPTNAPRAPRLRKPGDPAMLAYVGRLSPIKGVDIALEALVVLRSSGRPVTLTVSGSVFPGYEWYEDQLRARAAQPDLAGAVSFTGYVHPTWPILAEADIVLVPSRVESFGNVAVEALLARRPLVAANLQGLPEVVRNGQTGILVTPEDPVALAEAIAGLLDDPGRAQDLAQAGLADARERFAPGIYSAAIDAAVQRAISRPLG